mmetsp:Transcript_115/g.172  ORF Transcript_115/g.172 Transcript_115/m.172 type:complete len:269 (+) Transcript_115:99-905(+)
MGCGWAPRAQRQSETGSDGFALGATGTDQKIQTSASSRANVVAPLELLDERIDYTARPCTSWARKIWVVDESQEDDEAPAKSAAPQTSTASGEAGSTFLTAAANWKSYELVLDDVDEPLRMTSAAEPSEAEVVPSYREGRSSSSLMRRHAIENLHANSSGHRGNRHFLLSQGVESADAERIPRRSLGRNWRGIARDSDGDSNSPRSVNSEGSSSEPARPISVNADGQAWSRSARPWMNPRRPSPYGEDKVLQIHVAKNSVESDAAPSQ